MEKASTSRHNGALVDLLIGMIGDETSLRYLNPYLECECELGHVVSLMTLNETGVLHPALRDRCRIIHFRRRGVEHLPLLARRFLAWQFEGTIA